VQQFRYQYQTTVEILPGGDPRAVGAAVTVAVCGHWDHTGPCRWPHVTNVDSHAAGRLGITVRFDCDPADEHEARQCIRAAVALGSLVGPDDHKTEWRIVGESEKGGS